MDRFRLSFSAVFMVFVWLLAACGGQSTATSPPAPASTQAPLTAAPAEGGEGEGLLVSFTASPEQVSSGQCTTLQWQVTGPHFVVFLEDQEVADQGSQQVCPEESRPYTLRVDLGGRMEERTVTVTVGEGSDEAASTENAPTGEPPAADAHGGRYDFEQDTAGWTLGDGWSRAQLPGGGYALQGQGNEGRAVLNTTGAIGYVQFRFQQETLGDGFSVSLGTEEQSYTLEFAARGACLFRWPPEQGETERCIFGHYPILPKKFYTVAFYLGENSIDIFIDGKPVVGTDLTQPLDTDRTLTFTALTSSSGRVWVDDVEVKMGAVPPPSKARSPYSWQPGPDVGPFVNGVAQEDFTLQGNESLTLKGGRYMAYSDIHLRGNASLTIEANTALYISDIFLDDHASLTIKGGYLIPTGAVMQSTDTIQKTPPDLLGAIYANGSSTVTIANAKLHIHFIDANNQSHLVIKGTRFFTPGGGLVTPYGAAVIEVEDSTIGAISLNIPQGATFKANGLKPGHFDDLDLKRDMALTGVQYNLTLKNTDIVPDTLPTGYASDASERGWELEVHEKAQVELTDSEIRKLTFQIPGDGPPLTFQNLGTGTPMNTTVGPVTLKNTTVRGQWGFYIHGNRQVTIRDSYAIWPLPYDTSTVTIVNSTLNEFDPRQYTGTITFENSHWYGPGEIIMDCNFKMRGSLDFRVPSLDWRGSVVTREYTIAVQDASGQPLSGITLTLTRGNETVTATTDAQGQAVVSLKFDDSNYTEKWALTTDQGHKAEIGFFTTTPVVLKP